MDSFRCVREGVFLELKVMLKSGRINCTETAFLVDAFSSEFSARMFFRYENAQTSRFTYATTDVP